MAKLIQAFNARNFNPTQSIGSFPIGNHLIKAISSDVKATKAGDGGKLEFDAVILEGPNAGSHGVVRFNLYSASPDAARIAHQQFSAMAHCCGVLDVQDSAQLHEIPFRIEVGLQKEPNPEKYTEIKRFFDQNGHEPVAGGQPNQGGQQGGQSSQGGQQQGNGGAQGGGWGNQGGGNAQQGNQGGQADQGNQQGGQWGNGNGNGNQGQQDQGGQQNGNQGGNGGGSQWGNGNQGGGNQGGNGGGQWGNNGGGNGGGNGGQWGTK